MAKEIHYASFLRRLACHTIDSLLMLSIMLPLLYYLTPFDISRHVATHGHDPVVAFGFDDMIINDLLPMIIVVTLWVLYSGTPGKLLLDCHIVDAKTGRNIGVLQAIVRYLGYIVSALPFLLGFFWIIWDKGHQAFHDKLARTVVIYTPDEARWRQRSDESQKSIEQLLKDAT